MSQRRQLPGEHVGTHHQVEGATFFAILGSQRCGTNFLRELLGTNPQTVVHGEIFTPFPLPNCWHYFEKNVTYRSVPPMYAPEAMLLFDDYLVHLREDVKRGYMGKAGDIQAVGLDIKYNHLRGLTPIHRDLSQRPFLLDYFARRNMPVVHMVRRNVLHQGLSLAIAETRNVYHNYGGGSSNTAPVEIDPDLILARTRWVAGERKTLASMLAGIHVLEIAYEDVVASCAGTEPGAQIEVGASLSEKGDAAAPDELPALADVADFLGVIPEFQNPASLRKVVDRPYSELLANYARVRKAIEDSEFASFSETV